MAGMGHWEKSDHKDLLAMLAETEIRFLLGPLVSLVTLGRWGGQVLKVRKVLLALVENLALMENQEQEVLKVLKENQVHLDLDLKDVQERRGIQGVQEL